MTDLISLLIDLIFENMFIFILIGGFIFNLVKRFAIGGKTAPKKQQQPMQEKSPIEEFKQLVNTREPEVQPREQFGKAKNLQEEYMNARKMINGSMNTGIPTMQMSHSAPVIKGRTSRRIGNISISKKHAAEGVIWSEILGPPRSKKPHYSRKW